MPDFSDYIVYVDESGDHSLQVVYEDHPIFSLAFCIFDKIDYSKNVLPQVARLKFEFWGHDSIVLHSHNIRKKIGQFVVLDHLPTAERFIEGLNNIVTNSSLTIISSVINKNDLKARYKIPRNPYHLSLLYCLII